MAASRISQIAAHLNFPKGMLAGQVAIITGSGQGIGAEAARLFANEGALVVVSDIDAEKAASVAESINSAGGRALAVPGDMLDSKYIQTLVEKAAEFGSGKIHIIVNNAGMCLPSPLTATILHNPPCCRPSGLTGLRIHIRRRHPQDDRQAVGHNYGPAHQGTLPAGPRRSALLPRQGRRAPVRGQHLEHVGHPRQRWAGELRRGQGWRDWPHQDDREGMGPCFWRAV